MWLCTDVSDYCPELVYQMELTCDHPLCNNDG